MKKRCFLGCFLIITLCLMGEAYLFYKYEGRIHHKLAMHQEKKVRDAEFELMNEKIVDIDDLPVLQDETDAWYMRYHIISHGGGNVEGRYSTNSREAWEYSYSRGNRLIDVDLRFTADSVLVARHDWFDNLECGYESIILPSSMRGNGGLVVRTNTTEKKNEIPTYQEFISSLIFHKYTPQDVDSLITFMERNSDVYCLLDMKEDVKKGYHYLIQKIQSSFSDKNKILDRIVVSCYLEDYDTISSIYPFKHYIIRQYFYRPSNYSEIAKLCIEKKIHAVSISQRYVHDEGVRKLMEKGIHIYVAVNDSYDEFVVHRKMGVTGCISNLLYEDDFRMDDKL